MRVGNKSENYWLVSVEMRSVDESANYMSGQGEVVRKLKEILSVPGFDKFVHEYVGSIGYDDFTLQVQDKQDAICVASYLDRMLGKASEEYRKEWQLETNAMVAGPYFDNIDSDGFADMQTAKGFDVVYGEI